jgi:hypothetical protein
VFDKHLRLSEYKTPQACPDCGVEAKKLMTLGGIQDDHPVWLDQSVRNQLQDTDSHHIPIETRKQYDKHLKDNGIIPSR